jgi:predicted enzyme related to lactoylglutathione lyase
MSVELPEVPAGNAKHPIPLIVISANRLAESTAFYSSVFGWNAFPMSAELTAMVASSGPGISLRANIPSGFPGVVPYIGVPNPQEALDRVVATGCSVDRAPWNIPMVGTMARFKDASSTIYGLTTGIAPGAAPRIPMPFGNNPRPPAGSICSLEMYAVDGSAAAQFFHEQFGWGSLPTMQHYVAFDPGAGVGGVFQSHTPATPALAYVYVADVSATLAAIDAAGGKRMGDAMPMPGMGCFGYFTDPSGTAMGLIGPS